MLSPIKFGFFGGDLRQVYMAATLLSKGYQVAHYGLIANPIDYINGKCNAMEVSSLKELFHHSSILIGPIPMTRDQIHINGQNSNDDFTLDHIESYLMDTHTLIGGNFPSKLITLCQNKSISYLDLMKDEQITILNAIATAEGTIMEAIRNSTCNLHGSNCLVLGYGRCAKVLAQKLKALDAHVTVAARSDEALAYAEAFGCNTIKLSDMSPFLPDYQFIFNTIPSMILDKNLLDHCNPHALIIDISSAPGGVDFKYAESIQLNAQLCLGLPGKYASKSSSDILVNAILTFIKERSDIHVS